MPKKQSNAKKTQLDANMNFEAALSELQKIVTRMENEQQDLDDSISDYEQGSALATLCQKQLDEAQLKVEQLVKTRDGYRFEPLESSKDE